MDSLINLREKATLLLPVAPISMAEPLRLVLPVAVLHAAEPHVILLQRWWKRERATPRPRCRHCGYRYTHMCLLCYKERCLTIYNEYYGSDDESATTSTSVGGVGGVY